MSGLSPFITDFPAPLEARDASSLESVALISKISFLIFSLSSFAFDFERLFNQISFTKLFFTSSNNGSISLPTPLFKLDDALLLLKIDAFLFFGGSPFLG